MQSSYSQRTKHTAKELGVSLLLGLATRWLTLTDHNGRVGTPSFVRIFYCNYYIGVFLYYFWHLGELRSHRLQPLHDPHKNTNKFFRGQFGLRRYNCLLGFLSSVVSEFMQILLGDEGNQKLFCQIGISSYGTGISLSIYSILAITVDRFLFVSRPLKYPIIMTWLRTYVALIAIWLSAIIHASILAFNTEETSKRLYCKVDLFVCYFGGVIYYWIPFIALFALNYKIFKVARNQRRRITVNFVPSSLSNMPCSAAPNLNMSRRGITQQLRIIKTFAIVIGVFILCTIPHILIKTIEAFGCAFNCAPTSVRVATGLLLGANSVFNPFIYGVRHKEYRNAFRQLFAKVRLGTRIQWIYAGNIG